MITIDTKDENQVNHAIRLIAAYKFHGVDCELCKRPMLQNGILYDRAICINAPPQSVTWSHRCCYNRQN